MQLKIPNNQLLIYIPSVLQVLKFAWVQYIAVLIPVWILLVHFLLGYLVKSRVFETVQKSELTPNAKF